MKQIGHRNLSITWLKVIKKYGWDGEWFIRAYDYYGHKIGSNENEELKYS